MPRAELVADLVRACEDKRLFAFALWPKQRELLSAIDHSRIHVWCLGRRSGKSTLAAVACLWDCLLRPELDRMVLAGTTRYAVAVATNISQARLILAAARSVIEASPALSVLKSGETEDELRFTLPTGAKTALRAFPCSSRGGRGAPISCLVMDEAAHFLTESDGDRAAERVFEALVPCTAQFGEHGRIIVSSTPYGMNGLFYDLWVRVSNGEVHGTVQHATTAQANPTVTPELLALEERRDPESFRAEYMAEFTSSGDAFLDFDRIELADAPTAKPKDAHSWVAGHDPAFSKDPYGVALVGRSPSGQMLVGPVLAIRARGDFSGPVDEAARVTKEYKAAAVTDQFSSAAVVERLRSHGVRVRMRAMTPQSKTEIFQALRARLYDGTLVLPNHPELIAQLRRLRTKYSAGSAAVFNPRVDGSHGDMAQALALAVGELARSVAVGAPVLVGAGSDRWGLVRERAFVEQ